jgi:3',5'-cyclic-AMP phosphodiesterase
MVIAQISDMHVRTEGLLAYRRVETSAFLARAVDHLLRMVPRPDIVLATGDLVDVGRTDEYRRLRRLLAPLPMPVYVIPGNHDDRAGLVAAFADHPYLPRDGGFLQYVIEEYPLRLIALDTVVPGEGGGLMCAERLAWLDARLGEAPTRPTLIFMHHPPFLTGIGHMDRLGLEGADAMARVVERHRHVELVTCGHLHRAIQKRWCATVACTAPSTAHQVALDVRDDAPAEFTLEPPGCLVHLWRDGLGLVTHASPIGEFPGPFLFREGTHVA